MVQRRCFSLAVVFVLVALTSGCAPVTISVPYSPSGITGLPDLEAVAVFQLTDKRGEDEPNRIGGIYGGYRNLINKIYGSEPAAHTVSRAIVAGLGARGFRVIDMTDTSYVPRVARPGARIVVAGDLKEFWTESQWRYKALCAVVLQLYEVSSGRKVWEKSYAAEESTWDTSGKNLRDFLSSQLSQMVLAIVNDPELFAHVGRQ